MKLFIQLTLTIGAVVHLLPLAGVAGARRLEVLYGVRADEPNMLVLLRHRALLFGLLGLFLGYAALEPGLHRAGLLAGLVSLAGYLWICGITAGVNRALRRVALIDRVVLVLFVLALAAELAIAATQK